MTTAPVAATIISIRSLQLRQMNFTIDNIITSLQQHHYKITPQRRRIIEFIAHSNRHLTPLAIYQHVHANSPDIGLVTIYRTLETLSKMGFICEVHMPGEKRSYILRRPVEHHHHLVCYSCGKVVNFNYCDVSELEKQLYRDTGFSVESHLLEFHGICPRCQQESAAQA